MGNHRDCAVLAVVARRFVLVVVDADLHSTGLAYPNILLYLRSVERLGTVESPAFDCFGIAVLLVRVCVLISVSGRADGFDSTGLAYPNTVLHKVLEVGADTNPASIAVFFDALVVDLISVTSTLDVMIGFFKCNCSAGNWISSTFARLMVVRV